MTFPSEFPWPKRGDNAFREDSLDSKMVHLDSLTLGKPGAYAAGFKMAADMLVDSALADTRNPDLLFFPIAYLYRQYLELELKNFLSQGIASDLVTVRAGILLDHNLSCLWNKTRPLIEAHVGQEQGATPEVLDGVQGVVMEFHELDPKGDAFRYARSRDGKTNLSQMTGFVSLRHLKRTMAGIDSFFAGCDAALET